MKFGKEQSLIVKGLAVVFMLCHHVLAKSNLKMYNVDCGIIGENVVSFISYSGKICVSLFVFITGYGISKRLVYNQTSQPQNIEKSSLLRWLRLEKNFFVIYVLAVSTSFLREDGLQIYFKSDALKGIAYMTIDAIGLAAFFQTPTYNETWWYMSIAVLFIFLTPILILIYRRFRSLLPICMLLFSLPQFSSLQSPIGYLYYWPSLMMGIMVAENNLIEIITKKMYIQNYRTLACVGGGSTNWHFVRC